MSAKKSKLKRKLAKITMNGADSPTVDKVYQKLKKANPIFINQLNKKLNDSTGI